jgi:hypothetical protein
MMTISVSLSRGTGIKVTSSGFSFQKRLSFEAFEELSKIKQKNNFVRKSAL